MRTTLTLDEDVAAKLRNAAKGRKFKDVTNRALRLGLAAMDTKSTTELYVTRVVQGKPRVMNLDNVAEVIAQTEGEDWR